MKRVLVVEMFGRKLMVFCKPGVQYEFKVYEQRGTRVWLDEFESFQESLEFITAELHR